VVLEVVPPLTEFSSELSELVVFLSFFLSLLPPLFSCLTIELTVELSLLVALFEPEFLLLARLAADGIVGADGAAEHFRALVLGPVWPGGAPPGSGTQALGLDGSVSLTPGWLGPSHE
jgi:hypothetical protein